MDVSAHNSEYSRREPADVWAAIDIGTNSTLLLIARLHHTSREGQVFLEPLLDEAETTKLGAGLDQTGLITDQAAWRTLRVVERFHRICLEWYVPPGQILVVGTQALRQATNSDSLSKAILKRCNLELRTLSPGEEARSAWLGAGSGLPGLGFPRLFFDIGGGSTELIFHQSADADIQSVCVPLGCVRLTEKFRLADRRIEPFLADLDRAVEQTLSDVLPEIVKIQVSSGIGIGGTMTTLGSMSLALSSYQAHRIQGLDIQCSHIQKLYERLIRLSPHQRKSMVGLSPDRADIIGAGIAICLGIARRAKLDSLLVSTWGIRHGILLLSCNS